MFVALALLLAVAQASGINNNSAYNYSYSVVDPQTGDIQSQSQSCHGDRVIGQHWLLESDGTSRVVDYVADSTLWGLQLRS